LDLNRRQAIGIGTLTFAGFPLYLGGCGFDVASEGGDKANLQNKRVLAITNYAMPLEDALHERTFMQWPNSLEAYDNRSLRQVQATIALIARTIARFEPVVLLAGPDHIVAARAAVGASVEVWDIPTEDLWARDSGPTFVKNDAGELAIAHIAFNGWGKKQKHVNDSQIAARVAARLGLPLIDTGLKGEQGGVEHDGNGLVMAHASCWVNTNRNSASQQAIGDKLLDAIGGEKMIWAPGIKGADITDYHIDALARFVGPSHVLIQLGDKVDTRDPWSVSAFETYQILKNAEDAKGKPLKIDIVPEPVNIRSNSDGFVASYVNYYVCNGAVITAQFGDSQADAKATEMLANFYPGREIVSLNVDPLGDAGGGIHCATQQQPMSGQRQSGSGHQ
jgi:agmatine deiminase